MLNQRLKTVKEFLAEKREYFFGGGCGGRTQYDYDLYLASLPPSELYAEIMTMAENATFGITDPQSRIAELNRYKAYLYGYESRLQTVYNTINIIMSAGMENKSK